MARGINIEFISDVRRFLSGTKDVEGALEDVSDSLDDVTRDAEKAGREVGDGLKDGARDGERAVDDLGRKAGDSLEDVGDEAKDAGRKVGTEIEDGAEKAEDAGQKLERKFRDVFDEVKDDARKASDDVGDETKRGFGRAEEAAEGFKDEAQQNFAETASSFDGSMDSIADMAQSTLGGLATAIPGAGIALAGLGAAAGAFYAQWSENAEKVKERISEMYQDMLESGNRFLSEGFINQSIADWIDEVDPGRLAQHEAAAADLGIEMSTAVRAMNGDAAAAQDVLAQAAEYLATAQGSARADVQGMVDAINAQLATTDSAAAKTDLYRDSMITTAEAARDYAAAQAGVEDAIGSATEKIEANTEAYKDDADQLRTQNLAALSELAEELGGVSEAAVAAGVKGDELNEVQRTQAERFMAVAREAGLTEDAARDLARQYGLIPRNVSTSVTANTAEARADVERFIASVTNRRYAIRFSATTGEQVSTTGGAMVARASGGPVGDGRDYLVGEHGPEILRMNAARGTIVPNATLDKPLTLDPTTIRALAEAIGHVVIAGASEVTRRGLVEYNRVMRAVERSGPRSW